VWERGSYVSNFEKEKKKKEIFSKK